MTVHASVAHRPTSKPSWAAGWPAAAALVALSLIPTNRRNAPAGPARRRTRADARRRPVRRLPHGTHPAHRRRHPLRARGRSPVPAPVPPSPPGLAPPRRPRPDRRRPCGRRVGAVDDAPQPAETRHRRPALRLPTRVSARRWQPAWSSASPRSVAATSPPTAPGWSAHTRSLSPPGPTRSPKASEAPRSAPANPAAPPQGRRMGHQLAIAEWAIRRPARRRRSHRPRRPTLPTGPQHAGASS